MKTQVLAQISHKSRLFLFALVAGLVAAAQSIAADRVALEQEASRAYQQLVTRTSGARSLSRDALAVLVFPKITKAGFVVGGQYGEGVLFVEGGPVGYYSTAGASWGLQAGAQQFGYAMFFMNHKSLAALSANEGFEVGVGPSVVVVDQGMGRSLTTMNAKEDIYAFIFSQKGLMAGIGLQGNKITRLSE